MRSEFASASTFPARGTVRRATVPSCDGTGPATSVSKVAASSPPRRPRAASWVRSSRSPPPETTTMAGASSPPGRSARASRAWADSALSGRFTEASVLSVGPGATMRTATETRRPRSRTATDRFGPTSRDSGKVR
jgi:hypothetical protein